MGGEMKNQLKLNKAEFSKVEYLISQTVELHYIFSQIFVGQTEMW